MAYLNVCCTLVPFQHFLSLPNCLQIACYFHFTYEATGAQTIQSLDYGPTVNKPKSLVSNFGQSESFHLLTFLKPSEKSSHFQFRAHCLPLSIHILLFLMHSPAQQTYGTASSYQVSVYCQASLSIFYLNKVFNTTRSTDSPGYFYLSFKIYHFLINIWDIWPLNKAPSHLFTSPNVPKLQVLGGQDLCLIFTSPVLTTEPGTQQVYIKACLARTELYLNLSKALLNLLKSNLAFLKSKLFYL